MLTTSVHLTDEELSLLDGKCRPEIQEKVALAVARQQTAQRLVGVPGKYVDLVARVVEEAERAGKVVSQFCELRHCEVCGKSAGYGTYKRNSRNHRKGENDYSKPLYLSGIEFSHMYVRIRGSAKVGCCSTCYKDAKPFITVALKGIETEISDELHDGESPRYKRYDNMQCESCGWTGHEGQMGQLVAMMGRGTYPGKCPECGAENRAFGRTIIKSSKGHTVLEVVANE